MRIAYFGHDIHDATIAKRVASFQRDGHDVTGYMMRRGPLATVPWRNIDLGETANVAYLQRLSAIWTGARLVTDDPAPLVNADVILARNLDMLACAVIARHRLALSTPLIYECLDIHHKLAGRGPVSATLRRLEAALLAETSLVAVSSPAFESGYFARHHAGRYTSFLVENRLVATPPRPTGPVEPVSGTVRIGWFGVLRCPRSLALLSALARAFPETVEVVTAGKPVIDEFERLVGPIPNMGFLGGYTAPADLAGLYAGVDLVWAGDFYQPGFNSRALLPNRLYEGGWFGVPAIAPAGTETAAWLMRHDAGFVLDEPLHETLPALVATLLEAPAPIAAASRHLLDLSPGLLCEPAGAMDELLDAAVGPATRQAAE